MQCILLQSKPIVHQHHIQLPSLSFPVNKRSYSWNIAIKNLTLKIQGQGHVWGQSLKSQLQSTSYWLASFWFNVNPPSYSYERGFFLNLNFKIQGQSHSSWSYNKWNILSTHISFILHVCLSALPFLRYSYLKNWRWNPKSSQGHGWGQSSKSQCE